MTAGLSAVVVGADRLGNIPDLLKGHNISITHHTVSYTHLDVYKRQDQMVRASIGCRVVRALAVQGWASSGAQAAACRNRRRSGMAGSNEKGPALFMQALVTVTAVDVYKRQGALRAPRRRA